MKDNLIIWIDEAGTLSKNIKNPPLYLYGGYWCLSSDDDDIKSGFGRELINFFPKCKNGEKKASTMKNRKKMLLIRGIKTRSDRVFHPTFIVENLLETSADIDDKVSKQLHKNYLIRRFVEECIRDFRRIYKTKVSKVIINIDDQSQTQFHRFDSFPKYINKYFKSNYGAYTYLHSDAEFITNSRDSKVSRGIQISDILANCKYNHYLKDRNDLEKIYPDGDVNIIKLP